ncbi:MAG: hypothetical protein J5U19_08305 [Candidatus Methanoperedens sp.]|nr:hypothetical protein [Candidatus Methanoperedens sp.]
MNWIKRLFGQKQQSVSDIGFDETEGWLEEISRSISEKVGSEADALYPDIEHALTKIKKHTGILKEAIPEGRFHLKMIKIAESNRDNMVKQVSMLIENINVPPYTDVRTIQDFHDKAMQTLNVCLDNMLKSYQYTKLVFAEESKLVIADVNALGRYLNELIDPVTQNKKILDALGNARNTIKMIRKLYSDIEKEKKTVNEKEDETGSLKKELEKTKENLDRIRNSPDWIKFQDHNKELSVLENKLKEQEDDICGLILPLNKALTRLKQLSESGRHTLSPEIKECLSFCFTDPKCVDSGFFVELRKIVESGALSLPSDRKDKILDQIGFVESSFEDYKKRYQTLMQDIEKKKIEISGMNIAADEEYLNKRSVSFQNKLAVMEKELDLSKKHLAAFDLELDQKKKELQQMVSILDEKMTIRFNS